MKLVALVAVILAASLAGVYLWNNDVFWKNHGTTLTGYTTLPGYVSLVLNATDPIVEGWDWNRSLPTDFSVGLYSFNVTDVKPGTVITYPNGTQVAYLGGLLTFAVSGPTGETSTKFWYMGFEGSSGGSSIAPHVTSLFGNAVIIQWISINHGRQVMLNVTAASA